MSRKDEILRKLVELSGLSPDATLCLMLVDGKLEELERPSQAPQGVLLFSNQWFVRAYGGRPISTDPGVLVQVAEYIDNALNGTKEERRSSLHPDKFVELFAE